MELGGQRIGRQDHLEQDNEAKGGNRWVDDLRCGDS